MSEPVFQSLKSSAESFERRDRPTAIFLANCAYRMLLASRKRGQGQFLQNCQAKARVGFLTSMANIDWVNEHRIMGLALALL
jgi:hypothetical protein